MSAVLREMVHHAVTTRLACSVAVRSLRATVELGQWVGCVMAQGGALEAGLFCHRRTVPGSSSTSSSRVVSTVLAEISSEGVDIKSHGKLSGSAVLDTVRGWSRVEVVASAGAAGPRRHVSSRWNTVVRVSPLRCNFSYNTVPCLSVDTGAMALSQLARDREVLSTALLVDGTNVLVCPETVATALTICYRLSETVSTYFAFLKSDGPSAALLASLRHTRTRPSTTTSSSSLYGTMKEMARVPTDLGVTIAKVRVCFFEQMEDDSWVCLGTEKMSFAVKLSGAEDAGRKALVVRELRVAAQALLLSQDTPLRQRRAAAAAQQHWSLKTRPQNSQQRAIIEMPAGTIVLRTEQAVAAASVVDFWFDSTFPRPVNVSLDIRHYNAIKALADDFRTRVRDEWARLLPFAELLRQPQRLSSRQKQVSPSASSSTGTSSSGTGQQQQPQQQQQQQTQTKDDVAFVQHSFVLEPALSVLSDLTPSVPTVLGWLGIDAPSTTIPRALFLYVLRPVQKPLHLLQGTWAWINESPSRSSGGGDVVAPGETSSSSTSSSRKEQGQRQEEQKERL